MSVQEPTPVESVELSENDQQTNSYTAWGYHVMIWESDIRYRGYLTRADVCSLLDDGHVRQVINNPTTDRDMVGRRPISVDTLLTFIDNNDPIDIYVDWMRDGSQRITVEYDSRDFVIDVDLRYSGIIRPINEEMVPPCVLPEGKNKQKYPI